MKQHLLKPSLQSESESSEIQWKESSDSRHISKRNKKKRPQPPTRPPSASESESSSSSESSSAATEKGKRKPAMVEVSCGVTEQDLRLAYKSCDNPIVTSVQMDITDRSDFIPGDVMLYLT